MCESKHIHMVAVKHILRYVRGTIGYGLRYTSSGGVMLHGYTDSDWMWAIQWTGRALPDIVSVWVQL